MSDNMANELSAILDEGDDFSNDEDQTTNELDTPDESEDVDVDEEEFEDDDPPGEDNLGDDDNPDDSDPPSDATPDPKDQIIETLKAQNEQIMALLQEKNKKEEVVETPEVDPFESDVFSKMSEVMNWDDDEAKAFKAFFKLYADHNSNSVLKKTLAETPNLVTSTMTRQQQQEQLARDFYEANPALAPNKEYIKFVATGVAKEMGESATIEQVLNEAAKRAYTALGIDPGKTKKEQTPGKRKPAFAKSKGSRKKTAKPSKLASQIDAMLETEF